MSNPVIQLEKEKKELENKIEDLEDKIEKNKNIAIWVPIGMTIFFVICLIISEIYKKYDIMAFFIVLSFFALIIVIINISTM